MIYYSKRTSCAWVKLGTSKMLRSAKPLERRTMTAGCFLKVKRLPAVVTVGDRRPGRLAKTRASSP